jgi:3-phenylpropionate/cinnamic acid dioxygenase small subunit
MIESTGNAAGIDPAVTTLLAKQQITEVLYRRARAGDRRDVELALSCYHDDATEEHEGFSGRAADFTRNLSMISPGSKAPVTALWHLISNVLIELHEDTADVESYHIAVVIRDEGAGEVQSFIGGRYLDRFAFRDGRWAITHRDVVFDWSRVEEASTTYWDLVGLDPSKLLRGDFGAADPLYSVLSVERGNPSLRV